MKTKNQPNQTSEVVNLGYWREPDELGKPWINVPKPKQTKKKNA
jgi:hypothetical protein